MTDNNVAPRESYPDSSGQRDLVARLRWPEGLPSPLDHPVSVALRVEAADEIEKLRRNLRHWRDECGKLHAKSSDGDMESSRHVGPSDTQIEAALAAGRKTILSEARKHDATNAIMDAFDAAADIAINAAPQGCCPIAQCSPDPFVQAMAAEDARWPAVAAWQPIETAPKDGTSILVTMAGGHDGPYYVLFWNDTYFESVDSGEGPSMDHLSHWQPLPAPPASSLTSTSRATPVWQPIDGASPELRAALERTVKADYKIGWWLSGALEDPAVCAEMKADINAWFEAHQPGLVLPSTVSNTPEGK